MARRSPHEVALRFESRAEATKFLKAAMKEGSKHGVGALRFYTIAEDAQLGGATSDDYQEHAALLNHMKRCL
jgi:hypothetical protein